MTAEHIHQLRNRYRGALLGLACGDALGTTLEFHRQIHSILSSR